MMQLFNKLASQSPKYKPGVYNCSNHHFNFDDFLYSYLPFLLPCGWQEIHFIFFFAKMAIFCCYSLFSSSWSKLVLIRELGIFMEIVIFWILLVTWPEDWRYVMENYVFAWIVLDAYRLMESKCRGLRMSTHNTSLIYFKLWKTLQKGGWEMWIIHLLVIIFNRAGLYSYQNCS